MTMKCPVKMINMPGDDFWREDNTCSHCGSLHPDTVMQMLEAGRATLTPTDKSYKAYVNLLGDVKDLRKLYFQHLSEEQKDRFIELHNSGKMKLEYPGYFYTSPFFAQKTAVVQ